MRATRVSGMVSVAVVAGLVLCALPVRAGSLDALYDLLDKQGIAYERGPADAAAIEAALAIVDPRASVVTTGTNEVAVSTNTHDLVAELWDQGIGYVDAPALTEAVAGDLVVQAVAWDAGGLQGVILDLRGAGGDSLAAVALVAGLVATNGTHLYDVKDSHGKVLEQHSVQASSCCKAPLIILTDGKTRDGSEILAAALQKHGGVMLVGARTLGDATVRRPHPLSEALSVVVAYGKVCLGEPCDYDGEGVVPDVPVEENWEAPSINMSSEEGLNGRPLSDRALSDRELMKRIEDDVVLRRAADILLGLKALGESVSAVAVDEPGGDEPRPEDK